MRALVLRPRPAADRTAAALARSGRTAIVAPILVVGPVDAPPPSDAFDAVVATSAAAFRFAPPVAAWRDLPVWTVGQRAVEAAQAAGYARARSGGPDAAALAATLRAGPPRRLLYLAGRDRKPELEAELAAAGHTTRALVVYAAHAVDALPQAAMDELRRGEATILHYSRRSAALFCDLAARAGLAAPARAMTHAALSADVAAGLAPLAPAAVRIAARPDEDALFEAL